MPISCHFRQFVKSASGLKSVSCKQRYSKCRSLPYLLYLYRIRARFRKQRTDYKNPPPGQNVVLYQTNLWMSLHALSSRKVSRATVQNSPINSFGRSLTVGVRQRFLYLYMAARADPVKNRGNCRRCRSKFPPIFNSATKRGKRNAEKKTKHREKVRRKK